MGAWGIGLFENDDALDWIAEFLNAPPHRSWRRPFTRDRRALLRTALAGPARNKYLDMGCVERSLAAAEVIAASIGQVSPSSPDELLMHVGGGGVRFADLVSTAEATAKYVRDAPAFKLLFVDPSDYPQWQSHVDNLIARLQRGVDTRIS